MFEKDIFPKSMFPNKEEDDGIVAINRQKESTYELSQKILKDIVEKILEGKSSEEKEKIIATMIENLQEDLSVLSSLNSEKK